jgi:TATA-box binding protein (TBP) (component of TFIID and TFIIIB)
MDNFEYNYNVDDEIDLDDYEFESFETTDTVVSKKPDPSILKYSTRTVNLSIFPDIDYTSRIDYIRKTILPPLMEKYSVNIKFTDEILKRIILYRIIKDSIPYEHYFALLCQKLIKEPLTMELVMFKIDNTQSKFVDVKFLYDHTELTDSHVNTIMMRDQSLKTILSFLGNIPTERLDIIKKTIRENVPVIYNNRIHYSLNATEQTDVYLHDLILKPLLPIESYESKDIVEEGHELYCKQGLQEWENYSTIISELNNVLLFTMQASDTIQIQQFYHNNKLGFRNQVTFRMLSEDRARTINIMIFQNGRMTFTGCRTTEDVNYISKWIKNLVENITVDGKRPINDKYSKIYIGDVINQSMNCHYDLKFSLDNNLLYYLLLEEKMFKYVDYKPNKFAGLKLRFHEVPDKYKGTVCIFFQSGKINIYRSASEEEIDYVYTTINTLMDKYYPQISN